MADVELTIKTNIAAVRDGLEAWRQQRLPSAVSHAVRRAMTVALERAVSATPVDTARARAAWVWSLEQLGGQAPAGWNGDHSRGAAIEQGRREAALERSESPTTSDVRAANAVPYIVLLETGTRRIAPRPMLGPAVRAAQDVLPGLVEQALKDSIAS